jgi:hypothetical protein
MARGLSDLDGGSSKVTTAKIGKLAANSADGIDPALDGANLGRRAFFRDGPAKVVIYKIAGPVVDVEAVREVVAIKGKGLSINDNR